MPVRIIANIVLVTIILIVVADTFIFHPKPAPPSPLPPGYVNASDIIKYDGQSYSRLNDAINVLDFEYTISFDMYFSSSKSKRFLLGCNVPNIPSPRFDLTPTLVVYLNEDNYITVFQSPPDINLVANGRFIVPATWTHIEIGCRLVGDKSKRQMYVNVDGLQAGLSSPPTLPSAIRSPFIVVGGRPNHVFRPDVDSYIGCIRKLVIDGNENTIMTTVGNAQVSDNKCA